MIRVKRRSILIGVRRVVSHFLAVVIFSPYWIAYMCDQPLTSELAWDDTIYASGFKESVFQKISVGDSKSQVQSLLGEPISIFYRCDNEIVALEYRLFTSWFAYDHRDGLECKETTQAWRYAVKGPRSNYQYERAIHIDERGIVSAKSSYLKD